MSAEPVVELNDVSVSYDGNETWALRELNLRVVAGERWVVIGPNGCGKSTLVQLISGYLHPSSGTISLFGGQLGKGVDWRRQRTRVAVVSAAFAKMVRPELCGRDLVMTAKQGALEPWWHDWTDLDRERAQQLLDDAGFGYLGDRSFGVCSEGERQQIQLARALMRPPELLVLDEPAAGLDLGARERLVARLGAVAQGTEVPAVVLVTHHVEEIANGFTHALILRAGRTVAQGPLEEALTSSTLSAAFELDVSVRHEHGRVSAVLARV